MLISHQSKFLFIHIQRTGGGSVSRILEPLVDHPKATRAARLKSKLPITRDPRDLFFGAHATALDVQRRWPAQAWEDYFKFAFVRNPYSWVVSLYTRIGSSPSHRHSKRVSAMSFSEYIDWESGRDRRHQHRFVCNASGELIVDYIGRLEHLNADVATLCKRLGLDAPEELPRVGGRERKPWESFYDDATRAKVAAHWAKDLELFGYDFDGPRSDAPAAVGTLTK